MAVVGEPNSAITNVQGLLTQAHRVDEEIRGLTDLEAADSDLIDDPVVHQGHTYCLQIRARREGLRITRLYRLHFRSCLDLVFDCEREGSCCSAYYLHAMKLPNSE
jgi:hypothetical protein